MNNKTAGTTEAILSDIKTTEVSPAQFEENLRLIDDLKFFLATAPANWQKNQIIRRYYLNHDEGFVSCVFWNNLYFITGTDIVRCIVYRFEQFGREILDRKKFEEGIFSDLRSLKCGSDAVLEASKSPFLVFLYKNSCLRTQKKQKVFFWFSVPHDKLFADALERDLKKESQNQVGTTISKTEPALSFQYDESKPLYEQLVDHLEVKKKLYASSEVSSINGGDSSTIHTPLVSSQTTEILDPQTFHIKEEEDHQFNVVPVKEEDDFPLDYFPIQESNEPLMIDPSIFINPPESYNDQYLIEQTYAKTPYSAARFEVEVNDDGEEQYVPVSGYRSGMVPPSFYPQQQAPKLAQQFQQVPYAMTNGQYYDQIGATDGEEYIEESTLPEYAQQQLLPPHLQAAAYPYYTGYPPYRANIVAGPPQISGYYYEEQQPSHQGQYYPAFIDEMQEEDGDDELYAPFEAHPQYSPFSRGFPSFQAAAPPPQPLSGSRLRHQIVPSRGGPGRVTKPSAKRSRHQYISQNNWKNAEEEMKRKISGGGGGGTDTARASSSRNMESTEEGEYHSLPTPESTAPDPWHHHNNNRPSSHQGSVSSSNNGGLNDYLEDTIYDEGTGVEGGGGGTDENQ